MESPSGAENPPAIHPINEAGQEVNMPRKMLPMAISILAVLGAATPSTLAQCNWSTKVILADHTNAQPGLTASGDRLILTWAGSGDPAFNSLVSFDGVNWGYKVTRLDFPRVALGNSGSVDSPHPSGGLGMTYSPMCGAVYAGWRDTSNRMWATRSADGFNWEAARLIVNPFATTSAPLVICWAGCCDGDCDPPPPPPPPPSGVRGTAMSAPALRGDDGSLPIGFAVTIPTTSTVTFRASKGTFNCDFSNIKFPSQSFFSIPDTDPFLVNPGTPGWAGASGTELTTVATGPPGIGSGGAIVFESNTTRDSLGPHWSNNGVTTTVNPDNGAAYIAWTCHDGGGDTCSPDSTGRINIRNAMTGAQLGCADWSIFNPAMTFFQGRIWIAWRGRESGQTGYINIASLDPF
jgi:hypothetical protein